MWFGPPPHSQPRYVLTCRATYPPTLPKGLYLIQLKNLVKVTLPEFAVCHSCGDLSFREQTATITVGYYTIQEKKQPPPLLHLWKFPRKVTQQGGSYHLGVQGPDGGAVD